MYPSSGLLPAKTLLPGLTTSSTIYTYWGNIDEKWQSESLIRLHSGPLLIGHCGYVNEREMQFFGGFVDLRLGASVWTRSDFGYGIGNEDFYGI